MPPSFDVYVSRDDRIEERGYTMGFERLWDDSDIELTFMPERAYGELRPDDLDGADGLILLKESVTADSLAGNDDLKVISRFGAGFDNVDLAAATDHGIVVTNAPQGMRGSVAQATVGMLIVCASHMRRYDRIVRTQGFEDRLENMGVELFGKTLGTIGLGQIGSRVAELLGPFDMTVKTYDPYLSDDRAAQLGVETVDLDTLLATSDFVTIHCPETHHMLGAESFATMSDEAYLVNTTRGGIYPDEELAAALRAGEIAGAAIDVFEHEPDVEGNPLLEIEDCLVMPHAAGINRDGLTECGEIVSEAMIAVSDGEIPMNVLNPEALEATVPEDHLSPSFH